jgi:hypothetical protein
MASLDHGSKVGLVNYGLSSPVDAGQWFLLHRAGHLESEQMLMWGILEDAIWVANQPIGRCTSHNSSARKKKRERRQAREWIRSNSDGWIFSFTEVCEFLSLSPGAVRREVESGYK